VSLSTAAVAAFYFALTVKPPAPPRAEAERWLAVASLFAMAIAVFAGIIAWSADSYFYKAWAKHIQQPKRAAHWWGRREAASAVRRSGLTVHVVAFLVGVSLAVAFGLCRL
jgi:H+/gluconate symporter-like permease